VALVPGYAIADNEREDLLGPNLLTNGSFENGDKHPDDWNFGINRQADASMVWDDEVVHSGTHSVRRSSNTAYQAHVYAGLWRIVRGVKPGREYSFWLWTKGKAAGVCWFGGGPGWVSHLALPKGEYDWQQFELRWTAPEGCTNYEMRINIDDVTEAFWIDDVTFREVNPISLRPHVSQFDMAHAPDYGLLPIDQLDAPITVDGKLTDWPDDISHADLPGKIRSVTEGRGDFLACYAVKSKSISRVTYPKWIHNSVYCPTLGDIIPG